MSTLVIGSPAWLDAVYGSDPTRAVAGRSRPTQRIHLLNAAEDDVSANEGRLEGASVLLLDWMRNNKAVRRFKSQPFTLKKDVHGLDATPDFIAEDLDAVQYVIETKPLSELTDPEQRQQEEVKRVATLAQMRFSLWTDAWPITRTAFHNLWYLRRAHKLGFTVQEIRSVVAAVGAGTPTLSQLERAGIAKDLVFATVYQGALFINPFHVVTPQTYVQPAADPIVFKAILEGWRRIDLVWDDLPHRGGT